MFVLIIHATPNKRIWKFHGFMDPMSSLLGMVDVSKIQLSSIEELKQLKTELELRHNIRLTALRNNYEAQRAECNRNYLLIKSCLEQQLLANSNNCNQSTTSHQPQLPLPPITTPLLPNSARIAMGINHKNNSPASTSSVNATPPNSIQSNHHHQSPTMTHQTTNSCISQSINIREYPNSDALFNSVEFHSHFSSESNITDCHFYKNF